MLATMYAHSTTQVEQMLSNIMHTRLQTWVWRLTLSGAFKSQLNLPANASPYITERCNDMRETVSGPVSILVAGNLLASAETFMLELYYRSSESCPA